MISAGAGQPELPIADVVAAFLRLSVEQRAFARLLAWDGLADTGIDAGEPEPYFTEMVEDVRRRQRGGELADELDPAYVLLMLFAAALAPTVIPQIARRITGLPSTRRSSRRRTRSSCVGSSSGWPIPGTNKTETLIDRHQSPGLGVVADHRSPPRP